MPETMKPFTYKFIRIGRDTGSETWAGKPVWYIFNRRDGGAIGRLLWYTGWRMWIASFSEESIWSADCLADVQDAIARLTRGEEPPT